MSTEADRVDGAKRRLRTSLGVVLALGLGALVPSAFCWSGIAEETHGLRPFVRTLAALFSLAVLVAAVPALRRRLHARRAESFVQGVLFAGALSILPLALLALAMDVWMLIGVLSSLFGWSIAGAHGVSAGLVLLVLLPLTPLVLLRLAFARIVERNGAFVGGVLAPPVLALAVQLAMPPVGRAFLATLETGDETAFEHQVLPYAPIAWLLPVGDELEGAYDQSLARDGSEGPRARRIVLAYRLVEWSDVRDALAGGVGGVEWGSLMPPR